MIAENNLTLRSKCEVPTLRSVKQRRPLTVKVIRRQ